MIRIVEDRTEAPYTDYVTEFWVCRNPVDADQVLGFVMPWSGDTGGNLAEAIAELGEPVAEAFLAALASSEKEGIANFWVHDPERLFPPHKRPVRDIGAP